MTPHDLVMSAAGNTSTPTTSGVFSVDTYTGTGTTVTVNNGINLSSGIGMVWFKVRDVAGVNPTTGLAPHTHVIFDTVRTNSNALCPSAAVPQDSSWGATYFRFLTTGFDTGTSGGSYSTHVGGHYVSYTFKKTANFFDVVQYSGNTTQNRAISHSLGVLPGFVIFKSQGESTDWFVWHRKIGATPDVPSSSYLKLNTTAAKAAGNLIFYLGTGTISSTVFGGLGPYAGINLTGQTYIGYLFAELAGTCKIDSYTGNGASQTVNCGFAAGARFILIKRTDAVGDWYIWDSARGIVSGNDPYLSVTTSAAEVTTDDSIDPDNTGFIVNQVSATNINVTSATYIFLAIA